MKQFSILVTVCYAIVTTNSARILGVFPVPAISHQKVFECLMVNLAQRGHHVVTMTTDSYDLAESIPNFTQINVHNISYPIWQRIMNFTKIKEESTSPIDLTYNLYDALLQITNLQLNSPDMKRLLHDPNEKFDLCFIEAMTANMYPIKDVFNCSLILISSYSGDLQHFEIFGNPSNPILYPGLMPPYHGDLNLWQKFYVVLEYVVYKSMYKYIFLPLIDDAATKYFGDNSRSINEIGSDADMLFLNVHLYFDHIRPIVPAIIYIGGLHIKPNKSLPSISLNVI
ncbi:UDP-glucosyltransferase 2-like [Arctopsyche grandis]|uniref:UDP-glucosyltransferase 2-like n=1 Tax=Arctopsyche grandis TaxID=121162 RepID=UPI00406D866F